MLSTKNLIFKKRLAKKLIKKYVKLYKVKEIILENKAKTTSLYKNLSGSECQSSSKVQRELRQKKRR